MLETGTKAPEFALNTHDGSETSLSALLQNGPLILYFYPADFTPGCTKEACSLRDHGADLRAKGAEVLGVSTDSVASHQRFTKKHDLTFPLLADTDKKIAKAYDAIGGITGMLGLSKRVTFIIDEEGKIAHIIDSVKTGRAGLQVLDLL